MSYTKNKKDDFEKKIKFKYPDEDLTIIQYTGARELGTIKCNKCGSVYTLQQASHFLDKSKKKICRKCIPRDDTIEVGHKIQYIFDHTKKISLLNQYIKITDDLEIRCNHCGKTFKRKPRVLLKSQMCPYCESYSCFKTKEVFIQELNEKYGQEYTLIGDYLGTNTNTLFKHNDCGFIFQNKPHNILKKAPCPKCKRFNSKGELAIKKILDKHEIHYESQKRFEKLSKTLSFDFFLPEENVLIEFQGEQHYHPIKYFGGEEKFKKQIENDNKKRIFCKNEKYKLLEISYQEINNIEKILSFLWFNDYKQQTQVS